MSSPHYFEFLGSVWDNLPDIDRGRLAELWCGYEQIFAAAYQKYSEVNLSIAHQDLQVFSTERWLPYKFNSENFLVQPAIYTSTQAAPYGLNLINRYLLNLSFDGEAPIEIDVSGVNPGQTTILEIINKINAAFGFRFSRGLFENTVVQLVSPTSGIASSIEVYPTSDPTRNASEFILGIAPTSLPIKFPEFPWTYTLPYSSVKSIPVLTNKIREENTTEVLIEETDFRLTNGRTISFANEPPEALWAKRTLVNLEDPWNNYGFLMDIYQPNSARYVQVIQGLWFALWSGPKPRNVKIALYLLFGLPVSAAPGVVTEVTSTHITVLYDNGTTQTFEIPAELVSLVAVGDRLSTFDPLVSGIEIIDKINTPGFIRDEVGRAGIQRFLTEDATRGPGDTDETKALRMLEEYTYLPQISVNAFIAPDINVSNIQTFLDSIKPLNKAYLFQVIVGDFQDPIEIFDKSGYLFDIDITPNVDSNETTHQDQDTLDDYEVTENVGLNLDPHVILFEENVELDVYSFDTLIDSFTI